MSIQIVVPNSVILNVNSTKFLGVVIDSSLSWKDRTSDLTSKLNKACFAIRAIKPVMSSNVLRTVYFYYFQSIMSYGIIFWGNPQISKNIFKIQKRILRIIISKSKREFCRHLFRQLHNIYFHYLYL